LNECPGCGVDPIDFSDQTSSSGAVMSVEDQEELMFFLRDAQDRTTHAVRSLAIFLFATVCSSLIGYALIAFGTGLAVGCTIYNFDCGSNLVIGLGVLVIIGGFIFAVVAGLLEFNKSKP
jgi:hypothetical protein